MLKTLYAVRSSRTARTNCPWSTEAVQFLGKEEVVGSNPTLGTTTETTMPTVYSYETRDLINDVWIPAERKCTLAGISKICGRAIAGTDEEVDLVDSAGFKMLFEGRNAAGNILIPETDAGERYVEVAHPRFRQPKWRR